MQFARDGVFRASGHDVPPLCHECGLNPVGIRDKALQVRLQMQQDEFRIEFEAQRVSVRCFDSEPAQVIRGPVKMPEHDGLRRSAPIARCMAWTAVISRRVLVHRVLLFVMSGSIAKTVTA
jgi:hypothetical protein